MITDTNGAEVISIVVDDDLGAALSTSATPFGRYEALHRPPVPLLSAVSELLIAGVAVNRVDMTWRDLEIRWPLRSGVFPPTWDALLLLSSLAKLELRAASAWDVGTGTGILGLGMLALRLAREVLLTDVQPDAVALAGANAQLAPRDVAPPQIAVEEFPPSSAPLAELIVCNPPYFDPGFALPPGWAGRATDELSLRDSIRTHWSRFARGVVYLRSSAAGDSDISGATVLGAMELDLPLEGQGKRRHQVEVVLAGSLPAAGPSNEISYRRSSPLL